jgi:membrane protein YqaA with SNARE-associated domain
VKPGPPILTVASGGGWPLLAFGWGFAEATFFFVIPDVYSSRLVLVRPRQGFAACFFSLGGAMAGGLALYYIGQQPGATESIKSAFDWLPGINPDLINAARLGLQDHGMSALFLGVLSGIPYKLYAVQAAGAGLSVGTFVIASVFARLIRFLLVTFSAWFLGARLLPNLSTDTKLHIHAGAWLMFYVLYFWRMGV